jgi:multidrug/hemolysin transport system ATP-binding protein
MESEATAPSQNVLEVSRLQKSFKTLKAVDDLSFSVKKGAFFAFLGENGAGKSTTIRMICGLLRKDGGTISLFGQDVDKVGDAGKDRLLGRLGVVFQNSVLDLPLSVEENLLVRASLYGIKKDDAMERIKEISSRLEMDSFLKRKVKKLSGGERRRADIARALLPKPDILILDEPTTGLDPQSRKAVWSVLKSLRERDGLTIFLTTHYMEEADTADEVLILSHGRIAAQGTPLELKARYAHIYLTLYGVTLEEVKGLPYEASAFPGGVRLALGDTAEAKKILDKHPSLCRDFEVSKGAMDEVFLEVTKEREAA